MNLEKALRHAYHIPKDVAVDESFLPSQICGVNVQVDGDIAHVGFYAHTNDEIANVIPQLEAMERRSRRFGELGFDTSQRELVHEDQTTDCKEYRIAVPLKDPSYLLVVVGVLKNIDNEY
jgi:uncharacterized protein (DUF2126 family)